MGLGNHKLIPLSQFFVFYRNKPNSESKDDTEECRSLHTRTNRIALKSVKDNTRTITLFDGYVMIIPIIIFS